MTAPLHADIEKLTDQLLEAAESGESEAFVKAYENLYQLCYEHEDDEKNHPLQWEILADFTEDSDQVIRFYQKALGFADEIKLMPALASCQFSLAQHYLYEDDKEQARCAADIALDYAEQTGDQALLRNIQDFIAST